MDSPRRHQLVRLSEAGWAAVLAGAWDEQARDCLVHWCLHGLPLVVTRQPEQLGDAISLALGLPAPSRWERRRLALQVPRSALRGRAEFPTLTQVQALLPASARRSTGELAASLDACRASAHAFGSYGWQAISGLDHLRPSSDLDLWVAVDGVAQADAVAYLLHRFAASSLRLDGELVFGDGAAVAWREWIDWRAGRVRAVMVKRLHDVALRRDVDWCGEELQACG